MNALDVVLYGHGWHQSTIYPVTAAIAPFLIQLIEARRDGDGELARGLEVFACAATDPANAPHGDGVIAALAAHAGTIVGWREERAQTVVVVAVHVPAVRELWLAALQASHISTVEYFGLAALPNPPEWAADRARQDPDDVGAAVLLAAHTTLAPELARIVERTITPLTVDTFGDLLAVLNLDIPEVRAPCDLVPATVVFAGGNLVLVRVGDRNVTCKVTNTGLKMGDQVRVGISAHGEPRMLELRGEDGTVVTLALERGRVGSV